jgi:hypothetical protein
MRCPSQIFIVVTAAMVLGFGSPARATPITYEVSGIASGTIGASTFTSVLVAVTLTGDTSNVVAETFGGLCPVDCLVNAGTATVSIPGIGTATITDPTAIYSFSIPVIIDPGFPELPYVIIGTLDVPPATDSFTGIGFVGSSAFLDYDLRTSIGPITASPGGVGYPVGLFVQTTLGNLAFTSNFEPTTQGTFSAATVPEPSSLLLFGAGFVAFAGARLRQTARMRSR